MHQLLFEFALVLALIVTTANYGILKEPVGGANDIHGHVMNSKFLNQHFRNKFVSSFIHSFGNGNAIDVS